MGQMNLFESLIYFPTFDCHVAIVASNTQNDFTINIIMRGLVFKVPPKVPKHGVAHYSRCGVVMSECTDGMCGNFFAPW